MELRDERLSGVGAQNMDTSGCQASDLEDVEFYWENDRLDADAVFRPRIDIPFSPRAFDDLEVGVSAENPILLDEEEDKENCAPPATPVFERHNSALLINCPFGTKTENAPDHIYRNLFK